MVAAPNDVQPASAGTTTTSDILQHYSTLTTAMDLKEKNGQLAEEAAHWKARTEELEKEIAGVGRGQSKREAGGQSATPPQGPAAENQPDVLQVIPLLLLWAAASELQIQSGVFTDGLVRLGNDALEENVIFFDVS